MKKDELRQFIRMQKRQFSAPQMAELSKPIIRQLLAHPRVKNAGTILMYCALDDEVQTQEALDRLVALGKTVLLPAVINSQDMELRRYSGPQDLITGFFNISEPTGELFTQYADIDVAVVPGMAFDSRNNRLGRGRGYYDRMLPKLPQAYKIGICFDFQLLPGIPADANDVAMDEILYE